jgi:hypothetical protein
MAGLNGIAPGFSAPSHAIDGSLVEGAGSLNIPPQTVRPCERMPGTGEEIWIFLKQTSRFLRVGECLFSLPEPEPRELNSGSRV